MRFTSYIYNWFSELNVHTCIEQVRWFQFLNNQYFLFFYFCEEYEFVFNIINYALYILNQFFV